MINKFFLAPKDTTSPDKLEGSIPEEKKATGTIDMAITEQDEGMISDTGLPNQLDDPLSSPFEPNFKRAIQEFELVIPSALFKERQYPPLHVFVSRSFPFLSFSFLTCD